MVDWILARPRIVGVFVLCTVFVGWLSFETIPLNLFPDTNYPVVSVVTEWPGAAADDVATEVTHPIEVRLSGLDGVRRVTSTSRDQVSAVAVEFEYGKSIDAAATDVANELLRVKGRLPEDVAEPLVLKVTDAARPVMVLAVSAGKGTSLNLAEVRRIADNPLRDALLRIPGVAEVETFGGPKRQIAIDLDRYRLEAFGLTVPAVAKAVRESNLSQPSGLLRRDGARLLLTTESLAKGPTDLERIQVPVPGGEFIQVRDVARVFWDETDPTSLYHGNGRQAVAISLLRSEQGHASEVLKTIDEHLPEVRSQFPNLLIEVADTQGRLIHLTVDNMVNALRDAVIMTLIVLLLFIGDGRAAFITALSIPLTYLLTFAVLKLMDYEFDMVTLTAIIIAVGLLADDAVVVIENIDRRTRELGEAGLVAAARGTKEILLADAAGTVSTVIVLVPIMYIGGYVEKVLRPLTVTLSVALFASLVVSIVVIPLVASRILGPGRWDPFHRILLPFKLFVLNPIKRFYAFTVDWGIRNRLIVLLSFGVLFAVSATLMPTLGRELMPRMDTGVFVVNFEASPDADSDVMDRVAKDVEAAIEAEVRDGWLLTTSTVVGAEPAVKSFGAERTLSKGQCTVNLVDRFQRDRSVYEICDGIRRRLSAIPELISANVFEFAATPLTSIRGTVDVMISGDDMRVLDDLTKNVMGRMQEVAGLTGVERTWRRTATQVHLDVDPERARIYGLTAKEVILQVAAMVGGVSGGHLRVPEEIAIPIRARLNADQRGSRREIESSEIQTRNGHFVPVRALGKTRLVASQTLETHQALLPTTDIVGFRGDIAVTHLHDHVVDALEGLELPRGYELSFEGELKHMTDAFRRLGLSLALGLVLLYFMLVVTFRSYLDPIAIMACLPLAVIGANWGLLLADKHGCLPSFMGMILLMGIVVNNGILLIDFAKVGIAKGRSLDDAIHEAVQLRTRPILMTAASSAVGMVPVAFEWAVGVERLSPLAVVAIGGLIAGTFLTLLAVPVVFHLLESARRRLRGAPRA